MPIKKTLEPHDFGYKFCRIRQSPHVHFWGGGSECPLPDGLKVKLHCHNRDHYLRILITGQNEFAWKYVTGFEILGVADGWRYEWEQE